MDYKAQGMGGSTLVVSGSNSVVGTGYEDLYELSQTIDQETLFATPAALDYSSSAAADASASTGAKTLTVVGLDADKALVTEAVTMNGQTKVVGTQTFSRVIGAFVATVGTGLTNAGDIYIVKTGTGGVYTGGVPATLTSGVGKILIGEGRTRNGWTSIPRGSVYQIKQLTVSARAQASTFALYLRDTDKSWMLMATLEVPAGGSVVWTPVVPIGATSEMDVIVRVKSAGASGICSCQLELQKV